MTGGSGLLFDDGPTACPFIALDRDRERRADEPDSRHRCYATPTPEPRALAHQRNFCLTANFSACPIFRDWAVRAAARPVPLRPVPPALALTEEARPVGEHELSAADEPVVEPGGMPQQVGLFDETASRPSALPAAPPMPTFRLTGPTEEQDGGAASAPRATAAQPPIIPPPERRAPLPTPALPSVVQAKPTPSKPVKVKPTLRREDIVPSWERAHYDVPEPPRGARRRSDLFSRMTLVLTALAVIALAALVVLLGPVLLHQGASTTSRPTLVAGGSPSATPSATLTPTPEASWQTYTIKLGDNLYRIATQFNISYDQLLAANPQITNPDYIRAGDVINIPPPSFVVPSPSGGASPSASG